MAEKVEKKLWRVRTVVEIEVVDEVVAKTEEEARNEMRKWIRDSTYALESDVLFKEWEVEEVKE